VKILGVILLFVGLACAANADTILLKNGDHLTGTIEHSDAKELTLKTDYAGEINLKLSAVTQIVSEAPLVVTTKEKKTLSGKLTMEDANLDVATSNAGSVTVPLGDVTVVRSESEQAAYEHSLHPGFTEGWNGAATVGFSLARGNSDTTNLAIGFNGARTTPNDKLLTYATSIYASNDKPGAGGVTADDIRGGARYDHNIGPVIFAFGSADYEYNELQFLNLRSIYSAGFGYHAIKQPNMTLDLLLGGNYTRESYSANASTPALQRNIAAVTAGEDFMRKLGKTTTVNEQFLFYPDLSNTGQYRFAFDLALATKINKWLGWQTTASDRFLSDPIPGTLRNDLILTTGLNITFKD
jgi:putative salt-induced outer membrane protein YdiY